MFFLIFGKGRFGSHFGAILGSILAPLGCSWAALGVPWRASGRPWALEGALGTPLGGTWPLLGLFGSARGRFRDPFRAIRGRIVPHMVAHGRYMAVYGHKWSHLAVYNSIWPYMAATYGRVAA